VRNQRIPEALGDPQVRIAVLAAVAVMVQAIIAKNILDVRLDFFSQTAALWVFIVFMLSGQRDRLAELGAGAAILVVTAAVTMLYAV
jgi:Ca2+/Na+ antiporter